MKTIAITIAAAMMLMTGVAETKADNGNADTVYQFTVKGLKGEATPLSNYKGKVLLVVNTATRCGFTPQYKGLESMYEKLKGRGFEILDFPCNQFGAQAPGTEEEIHAFCVQKFNTTFPQFAKDDVNGTTYQPLSARRLARKIGDFPSGTSRNLPAPSSSRTTCGDQRRRWSGRNSAGTSPIASTMNVTFVTGPGPSGSRQLSAEAAGTPFVAGPPSTA